MKKISVMSVVLILVLSGCASMSKHATRNVHPGDSSSQLRTLLGEPTGFRPSEKFAGSNIWRYESGNDTCEFLISKEDKVSAMACESRPSAFARAMRGFGQGIQKTNFSNTNTMRCTSSNYGTGTTTTTCN